MLLFSRHVRQVGREFAAAENAVKTSSSAVVKKLGKKLIGKFYNIKRDPFY